MKTRLITTTMTAAMLVASAFVADARPGDRQQHGEAHEGKRGGKAMMRCLRAADLDDTQKERVRAVLESSRESSRALHEDARAARKAVKEALDSGASDEELGALTRAAHQAAEAVRANRQETRISIESLLTDDQKLLFEGCASSMRGHRRHNG